MRHDPSFQDFLKRRQMIARDGCHRGVLICARATAAGMGDKQRLQRLGKTTLGFDLQKAGDIRFRQVRHLGLQGQRPTQRQAHRAATLAHARLVQMISNFPSHQLRVAGQRVERQPGTESFLDSQRAVGAAQHHAIEAASIQRQSED